MTREPETVLARDENATFDAGLRFAARLAPGDLVSLEGTLGAGKTVFAKGLAVGLGIAEADVSSPSFVLAIEHRGGRVPLLHVDLYRLPEGAGIDDLGIEDALARGFVVAVEWGERLPAFLSAAAWRVLIGVPATAPGGDGPGPRALTILPPAP